MSTYITAHSAQVANLVRAARSGAAMAAVVLLTASACGGTGTAPAQTEDPVPNLDLGVARSWQVRPAIVQTLRLLNPGLRVGDTLKLESVLRNVSDQPVTAHYLVCEPDLDGELQTEPPFIHCVLGTMQGTLAPGQSEVRHLQRKIVSAPGRYTIRVAHLLDPIVWVPAELTVHPR